MLGIDPPYRSLSPPDEPRRDARRSRGLPPGTAPESGVRRTVPYSRRRAHGELVQSSAANRPASLRPGRLEVVRRDKFPASTALRKPALRAEDPWGDGMRREWSGRPRGVAASFAWARCALHRRRETVPSVHRLMRIESSSLRPSQLACREQVVGRLEGERALREEEIDKVGPLDLSGNLPLLITSHEVKTADGGPPTETTRSVASYDVLAQSQRDILRMLHRLDPL